MSFYFYPRSPCGERPLVIKNRTAFSVFLSTLSLRRATNTPTKAYNIIVISIHALLAESDRYGVGIAEIDLAFLSTLSLRRATVGLNLIGQMEHISIHALLAESDIHGVDFQSAFMHFYPRSPCGERLLRKVPLLGIK